ncbi:MAG: hypothetical protein ABI867_45165 [Kofleriaceae bacterium]
MRSCAVVCLLCGCELVFPLTDPDDAGAVTFEDAPDNDPTQPAFTLFTAGGPIFANEAPAQVEVTAEGPVAPFVHIRFDSGGVGGFAPVQLDPAFGTGAVTVATMWTPPDHFQNVVLRAEASLADSFEPSNDAPLTVPVSQHFGHLTTTTTTRLTPNQFIAMRVELGAVAGIVVDFTIRATTNNQLKLGVYNSSANGMPKTRLNELGPFMIAPGDAGVKVITMAVPTAVVGRLWLVLLAEANTDVATGDKGITTDETPPLAGTVTKFTDPLPATFPQPFTVEASRRNWGLSMTVAP